MGTQPLSLTLQLYLIDIIMLIEIKILEILLLLPTVISMISYESASEKTWDNVAVFFASTFGVKTSTSPLVLPSLTSFSENLNPAGFGTGSITQFAINTNTTIWVNSSGQLGGFGLYSCPTNAPSCTSFFDDGGILPTPALSNVTRVAIGNGMGCAVYNNLIDCCSVFCVIIFKIIEIISSAFICGSCSTQNNFP
jgi:hypothetical protein